MRDAMRLRLILGASEVDVLLAALATYREWLWPEGEDQPTGWGLQEMRRIERLQEHVRRDIARGNVRANDVRPSL